ncbi:MAG: hypothetical protein HKN68_09775 [Saprospiraceae bacterium]|nr:hypothetical protein [Saprospiraceae bacterium]
MAIGYCKFHLNEAKNLCEVNGIYYGLINVSVGIEDIIDIIADIDQALGSL